MAWFSRFTRFGDAHVCYSQEAENSCGIACVMMAVCKINKLSMSQAIHKEKEIYKQYASVSGSTYDGSQYSYTNHLASTLNKLGVGAWESANVGASKISQAVVDSVGTEAFGRSLLAGPAAPLFWAKNQLRSATPIIVLVGWGAGGAHFVLVDTINTIGSSMYASVCDPWDGNVHITKFKVGENFNYVGAAVPGSWSLGGEKHEYKKPAKGSMNGWVVRRKS